MERTGSGCAPGTIGAQGTENPYSTTTPDAVTESATPPHALTPTGAPAPPGFAHLPRPLRTTVGIAALLCLAVSLVHVVMLFLYVAPSNEVSQRYNKQINSWIYPLFEQNWLLFAPDPASATVQISARTTDITTGGTRRTSDWFDLTAVDDAAVRHDAFPSHTSQNMLRRAWDSYTQTHGNDDQSHSQRALMLQQYLRNIAVDRVVAHRHTTFQNIELRVVTRPIPASTTATGDTRPTAPNAINTRYLPWWKVTPDAN